MRERGIHFNSEMVRAVMEGRKVQTRRIILPSMRTADAQFELHQQPDGSWRPMHTFNEGSFDSKGCERPINCPFGAVGDRLWVRETWARYNIDQESHDMAYRATIPDDWPKEGRWRPSIHMPRWASRITLEITGVRVERLWDISEDDAKAEGCTFEALRFKPGTREVEEMGHTAIFQFGTLWESIYGEESWQANPWVWVIEFKRLEGE